MNEGIIKIFNLAKKFDKKVVFSGLNLEIKESSIFAISGESGCGKTTLLNIMSTLDSDYEGEVTILGQNTKSMSLKSLAEFRNRQIGIVFQNHNLLPEFTILENVAMPLYISNINKEKARLKAQELMSMLSIIECENNFPNEISGGQAQRAAFARAIINNPKIIFADEPTGSLDNKNARDIHKLILDMKEKMNITFVISSHSKELIEMADQNFKF